MPAEPRPLGRPPIGSPEIRGLRLDADTLAEVEWLVVTTRAPRAEVIRALVEAALADADTRGWVRLSLTARRQGEG